MGAILAISGTDPWTNLDGRLNAPSGTPQFPMILNGYPLASPPGTRVRWPTLTGTQPPWKVAGVDYAVGITPGTILKDPSGLPDASAPGATYSATGGPYSAPHVTVTGSAVNVIDGYDFSLHSCTTLLIDPTFTGSVTIQNCNFKKTANMPPMFFAQNTAGSVTLQYCELNCNQLGRDGIGSTFFEGGTCKVQYNYFNQWTDQAVALGAAVGVTGTMTCKYNLVYAGVWTGGSGETGPWANDGEHPDAFHTEFKWSTSFFQFNTLYQPDCDPSTGRPGGIGTACFTQHNTFNGDIGPVDTSYNTVVGVGNKHALDNSTATGTTTNGSNVITGITTANLAIPTGGTIDGLRVFGTGIPASAKIASHNAGANTITLGVGQNCTASGTVSVHAWTEVAAINDGILFSGSSGFAIQSPVWTQNYMAITACGGTHNFPISGSGTINSPTYGTDINMEDGSVFTWA